jgi:hypothetical protein
MIWAPLGVPQRGVRFRLRSGVELDYPALMRSEATFSLAREALARGVPARLRVFGRSMTPALRGGTRIEIRPLTRGPRLGDVVACERGGRLVVHRVVGVQGSRIITQGDALSAPDPAWSIAEVLGLVFLPENGTPRSLPFRRRLRRALRRLLAI